MEASVIRWSSSPPRRERRSKRAGDGHVGARAACTTRRSGSPQVGSTRPRCLCPLAKTEAVRARRGACVVVARHCDPIERDRRCQRGQRGGERRRQRAAEQPGRDPVRPPRPCRPTRGTQFHLGVGQQTHSREAGHRHGKRRQHSVARMRTHGRGTFAERARDLHGEMEGVTAPNHGGRCQCAREWKPPGGAFAGLI
jgi:hypothetical protein